MSSRRLEKVASLIEQIAGETLRSELRERTPAISRIELAPDLRYVTVWIVPPTHGDGDFEAELGAYEPRLQQALGEGLSSKYTPKARFRIDEAARRARRIDEILDKL